MQVAIGFGDAVTQSAQKETIGTILELPKSSIRIYTSENVIAEKFEAMVKLGIGNNQVKDPTGVMKALENQTNHKLYFRKHNFL